MHLLCFSLLGILTLTSVIGRDTGLCPRPENISPCRCLEICSGCIPFTVCYNIMNVDVLTDVFNRTGDFRFDDIRLSNSSILYFPTSYLGIKKTQLLTITDTVLASVFDAPPPLSNQLHSVDLNRVKVQQGLNWGLFCTLQKPFTLTLRDVDVRKIGNNFGSKMSKSLVNVEFTNTKTLKLGSSAFAPLRNIGSITVRNNKLKILTRSMFPTPYLGITLDFSYNEIETLPSDLFTQMAHIHVIVLKGNRLASLSLSVFGNLSSSLMGIFVEGNPIICDRQMRWIVGRRLPHIGGDCAENHVNAGKPIKTLQASDFYHY